MNKFKEWEKANPDFECTKCKNLNNKKIGEKLGVCSKCGNDSWNRTKKNKIESKK